MVDVKEKIKEYLNNKVQCVELELETVHDAHFTMLAYLQALADVELINMKEFNKCYLMFIEKVCKYLMAEAE